MGKPDLTCSHFVKSSLNDSVEFGGTLKYIFDVWCCWKRFLLIRYLKRFIGIQWNLEIDFRCLVLLENISFDKIFEAVTQSLQ